MCLIVKKGTRSKILKENMIVYKQIERIPNSDAVSSTYYSGFVYEPNVLNKETIRTSSDSCAHDFGAMMFILKKTNDASLRVAMYNKTITAYGSGFHFATTRERLDCLEYYIATFVIPAGSKIILDGNGLGITNQIMYVPSPPETEIK